MSDKKEDWNRGVDYQNNQTTEALDVFGEYLAATKSDPIYETPRCAMERIAKSAQDILGRSDEWAELLFFDLWHQHIGPSTPVWVNFGKKGRGLPIACFGSHMEDSVHGLYDTAGEIACMTQSGGGTSANLTELRARGADISDGGKSNGSKDLGLVTINEVIKRISQGGKRRGAFAGYLKFSHGDFWEWMTCRSENDIIQDIFIGIMIDDEDIMNIINGDAEACLRWAKLLEVRMNTGVPYIIFTGNMNLGESVPAWYGRNSKYIITNSNLCTEIALPNSASESFVCCLLSMNYAKFDEWRPGVIGRAVELLEAIITDFINKATGRKGLEKAVKFAENHRAVGLGVIGWATFLQSKEQPFVGWYATAMNNKISEQVWCEALDMSRKLAVEFGPCPVVAEYCKDNPGTIPQRHTTLIAPAPGTTNSVLAGGVFSEPGSVSPGIDPIPSNYYSKRQATTTYIVKNPKTVEMLKSLGKNTDEVWQSIAENDGSVQHLDFIDDDIKSIYLTAFEINQFAIVEQAADRQRYVDQAQSLNLYIDPRTDSESVSELYILAHMLGIKSLYYQRSLQVGKGEILKLDADACVSCAG